MVQSGIAYAAGQLLAVVAPRTVLVVDAPTDWSLAGPLWELALDDAPVDEILDVLIRRGIRTAPSFAIVRVESDAVRALVRGSVPVCFERVGEPVRLDATGATTWLEGLISGARRVLVGSVETNSTLPYLVSTGVVLVSGLALPCGPAEESRRNGGSAATEPSASPQPSGAPSDTDSLFSPPVPVTSASSGSGPSGTARFSPVTGREPRVVDLTRSESRPSAPSARSAFAAAAEPRDSWAMAQPSGSDRSAEPARSELNGHAPTVLEPQRPADPEPDSSPAFDNSSPFEARSTSYETSAPASYEASAPTSYEAPSSYEPPSSYRAPAAFQAPAPSAFGSPSLFAPSNPSNTGNSTEYVRDDPGELHDLDDSIQESTPAPSTDFGDSYASESKSASEARVFSFPESDQAAKTDPESDQLGQIDDEGDAGASEFDNDRNREAPSAARSDDSFDDLLIQPEDDEGPAGPAPTDLPSFEPPAVAVPLPSALNGSGVPAQPRGFGGAPAAWPPLAAAPEAPSAQRDLFAPPPQVGSSDSQVEADHDTESSEQDDERQPEPPLGELPLRVRGRSLRPEQAFPEERRGLGESPTPPQAPPQYRAVPPPAVPPLSSIPPLRSLNENRFRNVPDVADAPGPNGGQVNGQDDSQEEDGEQSGDELTASGNLVLPAFFRGARSARKSEPADAPAQSPAARETSDASPPSGPIPWASNASNAAAPAAWVPPVRRGLPERPGFNGGPPAMPGVLRPAAFGGGGIDDSDDSDDAADFEHEDRPTERQAPPSDTPIRGVDMEQTYEPPREPPRLLGVWCDAGHVTSPENGECRVCGLPVPRQAPILVARPPLGVLIFDNGDRVEVDRPVILGRDPKAVSSPDPETPVLHAVSSATGQVSRTHAEIRADGWDVVLTDLDAMNGTALTLPGASPMAIEPGVPTVITPGARVDLGGESGFVFEVEG